MIPSKEYDFDPHNLPQDVLSAIGLAVASAAQTESIIARAIAGCAGVDVEYGAAITTHMNAPLRDGVLRAVAEIRIDDLDVLDDLEIIMDHIKDVVLPKRNAVAHNSWCQDPDTGELFMVRETARGSVDAELIPMTVDKIKSDAALIYNAGMELVTFLSLHGLHPTFPPTKRSRAHKTKAARKKRRKG